MKYGEFGLWLCAALGLLTAPAFADGNRFDQPRRYHSEVSVTEAFLLTNSGHDFAGGHHERHGRHGEHAVIVDVRSIDEYVAGHPEGALSIPYPRIHPTIDATLSAEQKAQMLVEAVQAAIPNKETPILTLCKTGNRSISAANLLADAGYTHVRSIWEGFEGMVKTDVNGNTLDLNKNGVVGDAGDLDGWKNFAGLPYSTRLRHALIYQPYAYLYYK